MNAQIEDAICRVLQALDRHAPPPVDIVEQATRDIYRAKNREKLRASCAAFNRKRREARHAA